MYFFLDCRETEQIRISYSNNTTFIQRFFLYGWGFTILEYQVKNNEVVSEFVSDLSTNDVLTEIR